MLIIVLVFISVLFTKFIEVPKALMKFLEDLSHVVNIVNENININTENDYSALISILFLMIVIISVSYFPLKWLFTNNDKQEFKPSLAPSDEFHYSAQNAIANKQLPKKVNFADALRKKLNRLRIIKEITHAKKMMPDKVHSKKVALRRNLKRLLSK